MKFLENFKNFNTDILYIFDFDNTLVKTPEFADVILDYEMSEEEFELSDLSLPKSSHKEMKNLYDKVKNKAIVTGRTISIDHKISNCLKDLNFENPNFGLHCFPGKINDDQRIGEWKGECIVKLIRDNNFKFAIFFDDREDWTQTVEQIVKSKIANIEFKTVTVRIED